MNPEENTFSHMNACDQKIPFSPDHGNISVSVAYRSTCADLSQRVATELGSGRAGSKWDALGPQEAMK